MRRFASSLIALALLAPFAACGSGPSQEDCEQLLDHLIDLELQKGGAKTSGKAMKDDAEKQKKQLADYVREKFVGSCMQKTAKDLVECGKNAKNDEELAKCDEVK